MELPQSTVHCGFAGTLCFTEGRLNHDKKPSFVTHNRLHNFCNRYDECHLISTNETVECLSAESSLRDFPPGLAEHCPGSPRVWLDGLQRLNDTVFIPIIGCRNGFFENDGMPV
jgi:hypothetical protein